MNQSSNVLIAENDIEIVSLTRIQHLKSLADMSPKRRARLLLHADHSSPVQEMIIAAHESSYVRPHRHAPDRSESYHVIEGELEVRIFKENGEIDNIFWLTSKVPFYRVRGGWYHEPKPATEWVIYHEVFTGPFDKDRDVQYAPWAKPE